MDQMLLNLKEKNLMFNGKIQKIVSLLAGFCSVRFAYHLSRYFWVFSEL